MDDLSTLLASYRRSLRAENKAASTVERAEYCVKPFITFLASHDHSLRPVDVRRSEIEEFLDSLHQRGLAPASVERTYRGLKGFFAWCVEDEVLALSPMARIRPPTVPESLVPVLDDQDIVRLLDACAGSGFRQRRDFAILRLLLDSGIRRAECAGLQISDVNLDEALMQVTGKFRRPRIVPFSPGSARALDRYLRVRSKHKNAHEPWFWLSRGGRLTPEGIGQMVRARGREANIPHLHPHQLRHTFAHRWLAAGGNEGDLMQLAGWKSRQMLLRYAASTAERRAHEAYRRMNF